MSIPVDYGAYERVETEIREGWAEKWDHNHRVRVLPRLLPGEEVWVQAPGEGGFEAIAKCEDENPDSMEWRGEVRRNRKHVFPFPQTESEERASPVKEEVGQNGSPPALKQERGLDGKSGVKEDVEDHKDLDTPDHESDESMGIPELFCTGANVEPPVSTRQGCKVKSTRIDDLLYY